MAYMNQDTKAKIVAKVKPILQKYGIKATFAVRNHMAFEVNMKSGKIDFINNYIDTVGSGGNVEFAKRYNSLDVNPYWFQDHFSGDAKDALKEIITAIKTGGEWYDRSDIQSDYFDTAFYFNIHIGDWKKGYEVI